MMAPFEEPLSAITCERLVACASASTNNRTCSSPLSLLLSRFLATCLATGVRQVHTGVSDGLAGRLVRKSDKFCCLGYVSEGAAVRALTDYTFDNTHRGCCFAEKYRRLPG